MYDLRRDPAIGRLAAELLVHLRASRRNVAVGAPALSRPAPSIWRRAPAALDPARKITLNVVIILVGGILIAVTVKAAVLDRVHLINRQTSKHLMSLITARTDTVTERRGNPWGTGR